MEIMGWKPNILDQASFANSKHIWRSNVAYTGGRKKTAIPADLVLKKKSNSQWAKNKLQKFAWDHLFVIMHFNSCQNEYSNLEVKITILSVSIYSTFYFILFIFIYLFIYFYSTF